jgi:hypothetical protein
MQRTAPRAAADADRYAGSLYLKGNLEEGAI